jgi:hypothetical protein
VGNGLPLLLDRLRPTGREGVRVQASHLARRLARAAEKHNAAFFAEHGIVELDSKHFRDSEDSRYRLENIFRSEIELFAEGKRNKRAYIEVDETGKSVSWSSLTSIA